MATRSDRITSGGIDYLARASEVLGRVFHDDPAIHYMLSAMEPEQRAAYLPPYIGTLLKMGALNGGEFQEIDDWSCVALWLPPGRKFDGLVTMVRVNVLGVVLKVGLGGLKRMTIDFRTQADKYKRKVLKGRKYHYLYWIGTKAEARGKGLATKVIVEFQKRAQADGLPIWLEASTSHSRDIYARSGFRCVGEINMGNGTHAASGEREKGGPGVSFYPMIWEPSERDIPGGDVAMTEAKS